jgi:quercetin dioxygenase-like cupin family protein
MINKGTILHNKHTGEIAEFLETSKSSGGECAKVKWLFKAKGTKPAMHIHAMQDEVFQVVSGSYTYELKGEKKKLFAGESITMPKTVAHTHYYEDDVVSEVIQTVSPALDFEDLLSRLFELANEGRLKNGEPPLLEVMVWIKKYEAKTYLAKIPIGIQKSMALLLAPIGLLLGYGK